MENTKTKLGVSAGLVGAAIYFTMLFGGYTAFFFIAAYVFLMEDNEWLKKAAVKALALSICFSLLTTVASLIPDAISVVDRLVSIFNGHFSIPFISGLIYFVTSLLSFIRTILFILLGLQAIKMLDFPIGFIDKIVESGAAAVENTVKPVVSAKTEAPKAEVKAETEKKPEAEEKTETAEKSEAE